MNPDTDLAYRTIQTMLSNARSITLTLTHSTPPDAEPHINQALKHIDAAIHQINQTRHHTRTT